MSNFCTGCTVGFKYFDLRETKTLTVHLQGYGKGCAVTVRREERGGAVCRIPVDTCTAGGDFTGSLPEGLGEKEPCISAWRAKGAPSTFCPSTWHKYGCAKRDRRGNAPAVRLSPGSICG